MAKILKKREVPGKDVVEYLVQWVGDWADTWEPEKMLRGCRDMVDVKRTSESFMAIGQLWSEDGW